MRKCFIGGFFVAFALAGTDMCAQIHALGSFKNQAEYMDKVMDIKLKQPRGLSWQPGSGVWEQRSRKKTGYKILLSKYSGKLVSRDSTCLVLYPDIMAAYMCQLLNAPGANLAGKQLLEDLGDAWQTRVSSFGSLSAAMRDSLTICTGADAPLNADTVYIARLPLKGVYWGRYNHCTAVYACKVGRPGIAFKCLFTDAGKRKEKAVLEKLLGTIRYGEEENWTYDAAKDKQLHNNLYLEQTGQR